MNFNCKLKKDFSTVSHCNLFSQVKTNLLDFSSQIHGLTGIMNLIIETILCS